MNRLRYSTLALLLFAATAGAQPRSEADIVVMTQNQYLGADLTPVVAAQTPQQFAQAVIGALQSIAANRLPDRALALAESIADRQPHLVGLQEVFAFACTPVQPGACAVFDAAFNDHLAETTTALQVLGADYYVAAVVQNLAIPGLPVYLDADAVPEMLVSVIDRDVILARSDVVATPVDFFCPRPSVDGCNFVNVAEADTLAGTIRIERGFVGVDAEIGGASYRFVNTHLEVQFPSPEPTSQALQALQATELNTALAATPAARELIVVGDINSSENDPVVGPPIFGFPLHPPYLQLVDGRAFFGSQVFAPLVDVWHLRPGSPPGFTCCELADLSNVVSRHDERIDVIFTRSTPTRVKANVIDAETTDKTAAGLWPSDHASVVAELVFD